MLVPLSHATWQTLRAVLRAESVGELAFGRELRINPTRRNRDGTFLDELIEMGLLTAVGKPPTDEGREPIQFRTRYKLTKLGKHAAEYGEFEQSYSPKEMPTVGVAAALLENLAAHKIGNRRMKSKKS